MRQNFGVEKVFGGQKEFVDAVNEGSFWDFYLWERLRAADGVQEEEGVFWGRWKERYGGGRYGHL